MKSVIELDNVSKRLGGAQVLTGVSLRVGAGDSLAISGPTGAGKTTLLAVLGLLEPADSGTYLLDGSPVDGMGDAEKARLRNRVFGLVFQQFALIPGLSAWENVARPLRYRGTSRREQRERAMAFLEEVGLAHRAAARPAELSGGEQQRVAIARALVTDPMIVLADEPTAHLPEDEWGPVVSALESAAGAGRTLVVVTHEKDVLGSLHRHLVLRGGLLEEAAPALPDTASPPPSRSAPHPGRSAERPPLDIELLGRPEARLRGAPVRLTPRLAELLALLSLHPEGLSGEQLLLLAYGEDGRMGTLKAALSRLRAVVPVASQPYRLGVPYEVDALLLQDALRRGDVASALHHYRGPLLPRSEVPFLVELREHLAEALRSAVIQSGDEGLLLALAEFSEDDLELWELVVDRLGDSDPRLPLARSRLERVRRDWG